MIIPVSTPIRPAYSQLTTPANDVDAITFSISVALSLRRRFRLHHKRTRFFGLICPEQLRHVAPRAVLPQLAPIVPPDHG